MFVVSLSKQFTAIEPVLIVYVDKRYLLLHSQYFNIFFELIRNYSGYSIRR